MAQKPLTHEELIADDQSNPDRAKLPRKSDGQMVIVADMSKIELDIRIDGNLYNEMIQIRGALSGTLKSDMATVAMLQAIKLFRNKKRTGQPIPSELTRDFSGRTNFRGTVPQRIYRRAIALGAELGLSATQVAAIGLHSFCHEDYVQEEYELFLEEKMEELNASREEIVQALYDLSKMMSRKERLKLIAEGRTEEANKPKMNI